MNTTNDRIIIGIDPGTNVMGYGVLRIVGNTPELMTLGVIQLNKFESHYLRLRRISSGLRPHRTISSRRDGYRSSILRKERAIHAETRTSTRSRYGSRALPRHSHYRIRPIKIQKCRLPETEVHRKNKSPPCYSAFCISPMKICLPFSMPPTDWPPLSAISTRPTGLISTKATTVGKTSSTKIPIKYRLERNPTRNNRELSFYRTTDNRHLLASIFFRTNIRPVHRQCPSCLL